MALKATLAFLCGLNQDVISLSALDNELSRKYPRRREFDVDTLCTNFSLNE